MDPFRVQRIDSPRPHERTWEVTPVTKRDPEQEREQRRREDQQPPARRDEDDGEPPHLVDVQA